MTDPQPIPWKAMSAHERNAAVAVNVMGLGGGNACTCGEIGGFNPDDGRCGKCFGFVRPDYLNDPAAGWSVVENMRERIFSKRQRWAREVYQRQCERMDLGRLGLKPMAADVLLHLTWEDMCIAALRALGHEVEV